MVLLEQSFAAHMLLLTSAFVLGRSSSNSQRCYLHCSHTMLNFWIIFCKYPCSVYAEFCLSYTILGCDQQMSQVRTQKLRKQINQPVFLCYISVLRQRKTDSCCCQKTVNELCETFFFMPSQRRRYVFRLPDCPLTSIVHSYGQVLLSWYLMSGLHNFDKTDRKYSLGW